MGQMVAYVRVSSATQNTERQDFRGYKLDQVFTDKASGGSTNRPALQECMTYLRDGDTLLVHSIDRLARSNKDLQDITHELRSKGVTLRFIKENLTFDDSPQSELMLTVMGAMASFERSLIRERQREGIEKAKAAGKYYKPMIEINMDEVKAKLDAGVPLARLAREIGVSRQTLYSRLKEI